MPASAGSRPVSAFFIPGMGDASAAENVYRGMREQLAESLGRPPSSRRIQELWTRRGRTDCVTEVGTPDPISGHTVVAIFDMGSHQPFVIWHHQPDGIPTSRTPDATYEVVGCNAYSVLEFER
jgi:hypothetical protein